MISLMNKYTAAIQKDGRHWIGWIEEIPGVNSQGRSRKELLENLRSALSEALQLNRAEALVGGPGRQFPLRGSPTYRTK